MSNDLTAPREIMPAITRLPPMTASLAYHVGGAKVLGALGQSPHLSETVGRPSAADIAEALRNLPEAEHLCRQPSSPLIAAWCAKLRSLPKAPTNDEAIQVSLVGIVTACADLPAAVFTAETTAIALRTFKWWPGPAEVYELLAIQAKPFLAVLQGLRRVIAAGTPPPAAGKRYDPTPEALEHVGRLVKEFISERSFNDPNGIEARQPPKALHLSDGQLLAEYDRIASEGGPFAEISATRARTIRAKL